MSATHIRGKYMFRVVDERARREQYPLLSVSAYRGVVPRSELTGDLPRAEDLSNYKVCRPGDIVVNRMSAYQGAIGRSAYTGLVSPDYMVLRAHDEVDTRYLHHLFRSSWFVGEVGKRIRGIGSIELGNVRTPRINWHDFGSIAIPVPPREEQGRIADFLDAETTRIDALQQSTRRQIDLLDERLVEVMRKQTTTGDAIETRRTGIPWMPVMAADWDLRKVGLAFRTGSGTTPRSSAVEYFEGDHYWINTGDLRDGIVREPMKTVTNKALADYPTLR